MSALARRLFFRFFQEYFLLLRPAFARRNVAAPTVLSAYIAYSF